MKDLHDLCAREIAKCDEALKPFMEKHGVNSSFKLMHSPNLTSEENWEVLTLVHRKDAFVAMANETLAKYSTPVGGSGFHDTELDLKRRCVFGAADSVLGRATKLSTVTWNRMNSIPLQNHLEQVTQCLMANELELAAFGLAYLIYQKQNRTNRAGELVDQPGPVTNTTSNEPPEAA